MTLDQIWNELRGRVAKLTEVQSWTAADGYLGDRFIVVGVKNGVVEVAEPGAQRAEKVPDADFVAVLGVWDAYADGKAKPGTIEKLTKFPRYVTSILRALEQPAPKR
jgi:hypothetical protein